MRHPNALKSRNGLRITLVGVAVVAVIGLITVLATDGSTSSESSAVENQDVTVSGAPLAPFPEDPAAPDPSIGLTAPQIAGASFTGDPVAVIPGKPTLLIGLAHWCSHCRAEVPLLVEWSRQGGVPVGVEIVGVSTATVEERPNYPPSAWLATEQFPWPVIADNVDSDAATAIGLTGFPFFVMLDDDGSVLWRASGEIDPSDLALMIEHAVNP